MNLLNTVHSLYSKLNPVLKKDELNKIVELNNDCFLNHIPVTRPLVVTHYTFRGYEVRMVSTKTPYSNR